MYSCDWRSWIFSSLYTSLQCHTSFKNKNIIENGCAVVFFQESKWKENSKEQYLIETEIVYNIIHIFTVSFDQFKAALISVVYSYIIIYCALHLYNIHDLFI